MRRLKAAVVATSAAVVIASCTGSDDPPETGGGTTIADDTTTVPDDTTTVPDDTTTVPDDTTTVPDGGGDHCVVHDRLLFGLEEGLDGVPDALAEQLEQVTDTGVLAEYLGASNDPGYDEIADELLRSVVLYETQGDALELARQIADEAGPGVVSPVNAVSFAVHWGFVPAEPPTSAGATDAIEWSDQPGESTIVVIDTGFAQLEGDGPFDRDFFSERVRPLDAMIDVEPGSLDAKWRGHGTFVASIVLQHVDTEVVIAALKPTVSTAMRDHGVEKDLSTQVSDELQLLYTMWRIQQSGIDSDGPLIANMSLGAYPCDDFQLFGLEQARSVWIGLAGSDRAVAAAGNDKQENCAFLPAGFGDVFGVLALDGAGSPAVDFTNYADYAAPGVDVLGLAPGQSTNTAPLVRWSGTSFAAPVVAAQIARGESPTAVPNEDFDCT